MIKRKFVCRRCTEPCELTVFTQGSYSLDLRCPTVAGSCKWEEIRETRLMTTEECKAWACTEGAIGWQSRNSVGNGDWLHPASLTFLRPELYKRRTVQWNGGKPIYGEPQPMEVEV